MAKTAYKDSNTGLVIASGGLIAASADCCCGPEMIAGTCCGSGCTEMPKYLNVSFEGITNSGTIRNTPWYCSNEGICADECNLDYVLEHTTGCTWRAFIDYPNNLPFCRETYEVIFTMSSAGEITITYKVSHALGLTTIFTHSSNIGSGPCSPCHDLPRVFDNQNTDYNPADSCQRGWLGTATVSF